MKCSMCKVIKLSNEFPQMDLTQGCLHPTTVCMRCVVSHVKSKKSCPQCGNALQPDSKIIAIIQRTLDEMFREYTTDFTPLVVPEDASQGVIRIAVLNGDSMTTGYSPQKTIQQLKMEIKAGLKHDVGKQKLLYNDQEVTTFGDGNKLNRISDYNIQPNSTIYLVILMFAVPEGFDHVVFDLYWGYPVSGVDYLDASCLQFKGQNYVGLSDFRHDLSAKGSIQHSGDVMDDVKRQGHHVIHVHLKKIPSKISHLFFTLSAWDCPNISKYPNPSLKFYEADKPNTDLCKTTFSHANYSQAVVMCSVSRVGNSWAIYESGKLSSGNADDYEPIVSTCQTLIAQGY